MPSNFNTSNWVNSISHRKDVDVPTTDKASFVSGIDTIKDKLYLTRYILQKFHLKVLGSVLCN